MASSAENIINLLEREKVVLQHSNDELEKRHKSVKENLFDALQIISDLLDSDCPEEFKDVAEIELKRLREEYIINY